MNEMFDGATSSPHEEYDEQHEQDRGTTGVQKFHSDPLRACIESVTHKKLHVAIFAEKKSRCLMRRWVRELVGALTSKCNGRVRLR